jgi:hypothetical protein
VRVPFDPLGALGEMHSRPKVSFILCNERITASGPNNDAVMLWGRSYAATMETPPC